MALFAKHTQTDLDEDSADLLPVVIDDEQTDLVFPGRSEIAATRADLVYGHPQAYLPAQHGGYLGQVLDPAQISRLMGHAPLPTPRPLVKVNRFFAHLHQARLLPGLGVLSMAGLSVWAHGEPYHPLIGGCFIAVGALLIHAGVKAHKRHGEDADKAFTRGAVGAGIFAAFIGTGVTAGMSRWEALAVGATTVVAYVGDAAVRSGALESLRRFAVGLVAAGNTGPSPIPLPPTTPWGGPVSDEEYRLRQAFTKLRAPEVIIMPVRRVNDDVWSVVLDVRDTSTTVEAIAKDTEKLATWMGVRRVEALPIPNRKSVIKLIVHEGDDPLEEPFHGPGPEIESILNPLRLGRFEDGEPIRQPLAWNHTLVAGATDNGKSGILDDIVIGTLKCRDVVRIGIDCKAGAPAFGVYRPVMFHLADSPEDAMRVLAGLEAVYEYRGRKLEEMGVPSEENEDGVPVRKWRPEFGPFVLVLIDELERLTSEYKDAAKRVQRLNALVRFVGIIRVDATQTPSREVFGGTTDARLNYQVRIGLRTTETTANNIIMGPGSTGRGWALNQLDLQGKLMIQSRQHERPRVGRGDLYTDQRIARYVTEFRDEIEDLDQGSAEAYWEGYHAWGQNEDDESGGDGGPRGGRRQDPQDSAPFTRPHLVVVPQYPNGGGEIAEKDRALWQLLGEFGRDGATPKTLAARAEARGHKYTSPPWVRGRLEFWKESEFVGFEPDGREMRFWRTDLRSERRCADGAAS
jgi:hypothetical protein